MPRTTRTNADQQHAYLERRFNISVAGRQLEALYLTGISVDRLTIVFLHEGLGSVSLWRDFPQRGGRGDGVFRADLFASWLRQRRANPRRRREPIL